MCWAWAVKMAQWLRVRAALSEDWHPNLGAFLGSMPSGLQPAIPPVLWASDDSCQPATCFCVQTYN